MSCVCYKMDEDYQCLWYLLRSVCMSCVCDNARRCSMSSIFVLNACPVFVTKCTKMITVFDICYKVFVMWCTKMINVFYICYKVFVCPVCCNKMYEDYHCLWYLLQSICMSCVCDNARRWSMSFIFVIKCFYVLCL